MTNATHDAPRFTTLRSTMAPLPVDNIDTDQIIPAAFLKITGREGLARGLFHGWRHQGDGRPDPAFVLEDARYQGARVLLAGDNFGCGSSREHAAWALLDHGFRAVISTRFADIFRSNATRNGLLPVEVPAAVHARILAAVQNDPAREIEIDLLARQLTTPDGERVPFPIDPFARRCLLDGVDALGALLATLPDIERYELGLPADFDTRAPRTGL